MNILKTICAKSAFLTLLFLLNNTVHGQSWQDVQLNEGFTYQEVENAFMSDVAAGLIDSTSHEWKKFRRFEYFWKHRTQTDDPTKVGNMKSYVDQLRSYSASPWCLDNENPTPWQLMGPITSPGGATNRHDMGIVWTVWAPQELPVTTALIGTNASGLWRGTKDQGVWSWECLTDDIRIPGMGIGTIAVTDAGRIIIGTGGRYNYSAGVWISDGNGANWTNLLDFVPDVNGQRVEDIKVFEGNIYIVQSSKVFKAPATADFTSINAFTDITGTMTIGPQGGFNKIVHYRQDANNDALVLSSFVKNGVNFGAKVYMSVDAGDNWTDLTSQFSTNQTALAVNFTQAFRFVGQQSGTLPNVWHLNTSPANLSIQADAATTSLVAYDYPDFSLVWQGYYVLNIDLVKDANSILRVYAVPGDDVAGTPPDVTNLTPLHVFSANENGTVSIPVMSNVFAKRLVFEATFTGANSTGIIISSTTFTTDAMDLFVADAVEDQSAQFPGVFILYKSRIHGSPQDRILARMDDISVGFSTFHNFQSSLNSVFSELGGQFRVTGNGNVYVGGSNNQYGTDNITLFREDDGYLTPVGSMDGHPDCRSIFIIDDATNGAEVILKGDDGGVSLATNGGQATSLNFTSLEGTGLPITQFYGMGVDAPQKLLIGGTQDNGNFEYDFGTGAWTRQSVGDGGVSRSFSLFDGSLKARVTQANPTATLTVTGTTNCTRSHYSGDFVLGSHAELYFDKTNQAFRMYVGHRELYKANCTTTVNTMASLPDGYQNYVWGIGIHEEDDNVMFIGGNRIEYDPSEDQVNGLLRTRDGGITWTDITSRLRFTNSGGTGVQPLSRFSITDVIVDPDIPADEPASVYVSFAGWNSDGTQRVYRSVDDGENWEDISEGLLGLPVNDLEIQRGSGGILYAGTDAGVFVYDPAIGEWQCFNEDMPMCIVTEVKVNLCTKKLFASTFGRGIWQTDIYETPIAEHVISTTTTIPVNGFSYGYSNWRVQAGAMLTINGTLSMYPGTGIIVEEGAKLLVDGGTINSACGDFWSGIQVWGDNSENQWPTSQPAHQGYVVLRNGATIENAREAITMKKNEDWGTFGGVIDATDAHFINCRRSATFLSYKNFSGSGQEMVNRSKFARCEFKVDDNYYGGDDFYAHISMWDVHGIKFTACDFINEQTTVTTTPSNKLGFGIISIDAGYGVTGQCSYLIPIDPGHPIPVCDEASLTRSKFIGLDHGIHALSTGSNSRTFWVTNSAFENNICGVYTSGVNHFDINRNEFVMGNREVTLAGMEDDAFQLFHRAIYNYTGFGFHIQENDFMKEANAISGVPIEGPVMGYTGPYNDLVYNNESEHLENSFVAEGNCYDEDNSTITGLSFECNNPAPNSDRDFVVRTPPLGTPGNENCIKTFQGSTSLSAGNTFTATQMGTSLFYNYDNEAQGAPITYFWELPPGKPNPGAYNFPYVVVDGSNDSPYNTCVSRVRYPETHGMTTGPIHNLFQDQKSAYLNLKYVFESLLDGGDFDELKETIMLTWPNEAWDLRNELMANSPYLSVEILKEAAIRDILPDAMMLEICLANPEATKQKGFDKWIEFEAPSPLPHYMIQQIHASWNQRTWRTSLESSMAQHFALMGHWNDKLIADMKNDTVPQPLDSLLVRFEQNTVLGARYSEIQTLMELGRFNDAEDVAQDLDQQYRLNDHEEEERADMIGLIAVYKAANNAAIDLFHLSAGAQSNLQQVAQGRPTHAGVWAQNLLCFAYGECTAPVTGGTITPKALLEQPSTDEIFDTDGITFKAYPNPAQTWITFETILPERVEGATIDIQDISGRNVGRLTVQLGASQQVWDVRGIKTGTYTAELRIAAKVLGLQRFVVAK
ncbi:MAG: hypothetical protein KA408_04120 [Flavobacteriales bacterium]|nr:hypothetical protein [Flavobacteriales bacterium]